MNLGRFTLRWREARERVRGSLFYVPAAYIVVAAALAWGTSRFDQRYAAELPSIPVLLPTTVSSAREILGTIAGATITVAGVVFSLTIVAVQLASSQFSPRVLRGFLRDRFSQRVIGLIVGTFTYCLLVLTATPVPRGSQPTTIQNLSVTVAVVMAVVAVLAIVAFLNHSARSMQVGHLMHDVSDETRGLIDALLPDPDEDGGVRDRGGETTTELPAREATLVTCDTQGWIQQIDVDGLLEVVPAGSVMRLRVRAGSHVTSATVLADVWQPDDDPSTNADEVAGERDAGETDGAALCRSVRQTLSIGRERTMQQDLSFGIRQLVDIALRALSPGINDPTTAIEAIFHLGGLLEEILVRDLPPSVVVDDDDRRLIRAGELDHADLVRYAFRQIRVAGVSQPAVIEILVQVLGELCAFADRNGLDTGTEALRREARLAVADLEAATRLDADVDHVRDKAAEFGLLSRTSS